MAKGSPLSGRIGSRFGGRGARKRTRVFAGFVTLIAVTYFGTTFAASISLGSNTPIEFGQGSRAAVACDSTGITTAIEETWNNATTYFKVNKVTLSDINNATTDAVTGIGCRGKTIKLSLIGSSGKLGIGSGGTPETEISIVMPGADGPMSSGVTGALASAVTVGTYNASDGASLTITIPATLDATTVTRVALETE
jgi:hypothetical protein